MKIERLSEKQILIELERKHQIKKERIAAIIIQRALRACMRKLNFSKMV